MPYSAEDRAFNSGTPRHEYRKATRKMRWWYEALADHMIANPGDTQNEIAAHFGRAVSTISTIVHTDAFKAYFRIRRNAHAERLDAGIRHKMFEVADKSFDLILEKLEKKRDTIPIETLQRTVDSTLKSLGYGLAPAGPTVNVNTGGGNAVVAVPVSLDDLELARAALRRSQMQTLEAPEEAALEPRRASSGEEPS